MDFDTAEEYINSKECVSVSEDFTKIYIFNVDLEEEEMDDELVDFGVVYSTLELDGDGNAVEDELCEFDSEQLPSVLSVSLSDPRLHNKLKEAYIDSIIQSR